MSEADKLFENEKYEKIHNQKYKYDNAGLEICIDFNLRCKSVSISMFDKDDQKYYPPEITMQELKAINMKCKELGWSDE